MQEAANLYLAQCSREVPDLGRDSGTRTADLLHVAAALELGVDWLYSFDLQQRKLAQTLRLKLN
jgi:hypothetical protein